MLERQPTRVVRLLVAAILAVLGTRSAFAAAPSKDEITAVSSQLEGELYSVDEQNFDYQETLSNYLRRGTETLFEASKPGLYLVAQSEADVVDGVRLALETGQKVAFHGSGHHQAGLSLYPGGITIDVSNLKEAVVEPETQTGRFQIGLVGEEVANITQAYDLHYRVGHASSVGIAGFTLGGGAGWGGLTVDTVLAFDVVNVWEYPEQELAIKRVDALNEPELFFGLQGAGSMLAAVVAIYAQLQALPAQHLIRSPAIIWPLPQAAQLLQTWDNYSADHASSELLEASLSYATVPGIGPVALISMWDWSPSNQTGTADFIEGLSDASQAAGAQVMDSTVPYLDLIQMFSPTQQYPNVTHYCISHIIATEDLPKVSDILTAGYANVTSPLSIILVDPAKEGLKSNEDTAYGWRGYASVYVWAFWTRTAGGPDVDGDAEHVAWVQELAAQLEHVSQGHYINFIDFEMPEDTQKSFPPANWARVVAAKAAFDPYNLFRELDFHHDKNGRGPLDAGTNAAVRPVASGG